MPMKAGLEVFDFNEEDEMTEFSGDKYLSKCKNPNLDDPAALKYQFLECVAHDAAVQRKVMDNVPCVDVDAIDGDCTCDDATPAASLGSWEKDSVPKDGNREPDGSPESKSKHSEQLADLEKDSSEPRSTSAELELRDSCAEAPSLGKRLNCSLSNSPLNNEPVDMASDANDNMSEMSPSISSSDVAEDDVSFTSNVSDDGFGNILVDNINNAVVLCSDYVLYQDYYYTGASVSFSPIGIKIKGSTLSEHQGTFTFERGIDDIISIDCQWFERVGYVTFNLKVLSKVALEAENAGRAPVIEELKVTVTDPRWSEKHEAITSLNTKYLAKWNVVFDLMMGMDGDDSPVRKPYFPNFHEPFEEVIYPKGDIDAVSISKRDVDLLQPETFINDTIIDFYIKYLKNLIQPEERQRFHFFNSFFFRKLADLDKDPSSISDGRAAFLRVHKWTRKLDMFAKDFIFIPVNFNLHWSLIVICHPGEVPGFKDEDLDKSSKVPCILHMDSIKGSHAGLKNLVQSYLWEEWKERHKETCEDISSKFLNLRFVSLELPQQENSFDCGLFLLHYLERFLADAPPNFNPFKITKFSNFLNLDWFPPIEASLKRTLIQKLIFQLLETRSQEISSSDCSDEHHSSKFPEKIEKETGVEFVSEGFSPEVACHGNIGSQAGQGIEMTLLASSSMRNMESVNDSNLVLKLFDPVATTTGSLLGQFQSFDHQSSYYNLNGATSPREQDVQTGQQLVYLAPGENGFQQYTGITPQACEDPYSSRGYIMGNSWNLGISMQGEHEIGTSSDSDEDDDDDIGIIENNPIGYNIDPSEKQKTFQQQSQFMEDVEHLENGFAHSRREVLETSTIEVFEASENADKTDNNTKDADHPSDENPPVLLHQNPSLRVNQFDQDTELLEEKDVIAENKETIGYDIQLIGDDVPSQGNSAALSHQNPGMMLDKLDQDSEPVEKNTEMVENKVSGDDVQMIDDEQRTGDDLLSKDDSTVQSHQHPEMATNHLDEESVVVENKEGFGDDASAEVTEQLAAKRIRLMPSPGEEKVDS